MESIEYEEEEGTTYSQPLLKRRATAGYPAPAPKVASKPPVARQNTIFTAFAIGMCLVAIFVILWNMVVLPWWHGVAVRWEYGINQVSVFGADVGHGGTSRFIAFDNDNEIVVVEVIRKTYSVYAIPTGSKQNRLVTLTFQDVNHDGRLDIIVSVDGEEGSFVLFNTGTGFKWNS